jgi:hypothetical protein
MHWPHLLYFVGANSACRGTTSISRYDDFDGDVAVALVSYALPGKIVRINTTIDEHFEAAIDRVAKASGST